MFIFNTKSVELHLHLIHVPAENNKIS